MRKRREFLEIQGGGRRISLPHFVFVLAPCVTPQSEPGPARLGIVASRKVGVAVVRNRAKRLIREAFRSTRELFPPGLDVVVIVKSPLDGLKLADVVREWRAHAAPLSRRIAALLGC